MTPICGDAAISAGRSYPVEATPIETPASRVEDGAFSDQIQYSIAESKLEGYAPVYRRRLRRRPHDAWVGDGFLLGVIDVLEFVTFVSASVLAQRHGRRCRPKSSRPMTSRRSRLAPRSAYHAATGQAQLHHCTRSERRADVLCRVLAAPLAHRQDLGCPGAAQQRVCALNLAHEKTQATWLTVLATYATAFGFAIKAAPTLARCSDPEQVRGHQSQSRSGHLAVKTGPLLSFVVCLVVHYGDRDLRELNNICVSLAYLSYIGQTLGYISFHRNNTSSRENDSLARAPYRSPFGVTGAYMSLAVWSGHWTSSQPWAARTPSQVNWP